MTPRLSSTDAYALARHLAGMDHSRLDVSPATRMILSGFNDPLMLDTLKHLLTKTGVIEQVFAVDPKAEPPTDTPKKQGVVYVPDLPGYAQLSDKAINAAEKVGGWYRETLAWATARSPMTPVHFLQAGIVWLIGLAIARRVCIEVHDQIYPHLYLLMIAETSKYAKSTGLSAIQSLALAAMPHMLMPGQTSPEGMVELLTGKNPTNFDTLPKRDQDWLTAGRQYAAQRGVILDEYSSLLAAAKKDYMAGFIELIMRIYDAREYEAHHTKSGGMLIVHNPAICILGATTPAAMARAVNAEQWENGAMARYLLLFRDEPLPYNPEYIPAAPPRELSSPLAALHTRLPKMRDELGGDMPDFTPMKAGMTREAMAQYQSYMKAVFFDLIDDGLDERLHGNYRRMHIQMLKIALALAVMDWSQAGAGDITITLGHVALAQQIAEIARAGLHRLMPVLSESADSRTQRDLLSLLKHHPAGLTFREVCKLNGRGTKELRSALNVLMDSGLCEVVEHKPATGRPTNIYRLLTDK